MPKTDRPTMVKFSFGLDKVDRDRFVARSEELGETPSAIARKIILAFNDEKIKLPRTEAIAKSYQ